MNTKPQQTRRPEPQLDQAAVLSQQLGHLGLISDQTRPSFGDRLVMRCALQLLAQGMPMTDVAPGLAKAASQTVHPLTALRLSYQDKKLRAQLQGRCWDVESGQLLMMESSHPKPRELTTSDSFFDEGLSHEFQGDLGRALRAYLMALALEPRHVESMLNAGRIYCEWGDERRAEAYFRQAVCVDPEHPVTHFNLAVLLHDRLDYEGALKAYRAALAVDQAFTDAHYNLSVLLSELGRENEAAHHRAKYEHEHADG